MSPVKYGAAALAAALLGAGCASAPEQASVNAGKATQAPAAGAVTNGAEAEPSVLVLNARDEETGSVVSCRQLLKQGSNVIVRQCMSRDDWQRFERRQERAAQEMLRTMQRSGFP